MRQLIDQLEPATLAKLASLELRTRMIVDGYLSGRHRSVSSGQSVEFTEHREYTPGDDLRYVDWKVFGKTDKHYLKQYEAETDLTCYLLVDSSESMAYRGATSALSKYEYGQCLAAAIGSIVLRQRDRVSLSLFDNRLRAFIRASDRADHYLMLIKTLQSNVASGKSDIETALQEFTQRSPRRGVVVLISDLLGNEEQLLASLQYLRQQRHEVIVLHTLDPDELQFPFDRTTQFRGLEALPRIMAEPRAVKRAYIKELQEFLARVQAICRSLGCDYQLISTASPFDESLRQVLLNRKTSRKK